MTQSLFGVSIQGTFFLALMEGTKLIYGLTRGHRHPNVSLEVFLLSSAVPLERGSRNVRQQGRGRFRRPLIHQVRLG